MSNSFQGLSSGAGMLKTYFQGPMVDVFNENVPVYRASEKIKQGWSGSQINRPLRVRRNQGIGATTDGGNLPAIGRQATVQAVINSKYLYCRFGVTGPMIKASQSDVGSFVRAATYELKQGMQDLVSDANRQFQWSGNGTLATVSATAIATTSVSITGRESVEAALKFLDVGSIIDIYSSAGALKAQGVTVTATSATTLNALSATLTLDQAVTAASTDVIVRSGSLNNEIQGLLYSMDGATSSIYSVDRSTYPSYQGNVQTVSGQLTLNAIQASYNEGLRRGGARYTALYTDYDSLLMYQKLLTPDKRYVNSKQGDGSFGDKDKFYLEFMGLPWVADKDSPQRIGIYSSDVLKSYVMSEMEVADESGSQYIAQTSVDQYEVRIRFFVNLFNENPAACAVLKSYTSP